MCVYLTKWPVSVHNIICSASRYIIIFIHVQRITILPWYCVSVRPASLLIVIMQVYIFQFNFLCRSHNPFVSLGSEDIKNRSAYNTTVTCRHETVTQEHDGNCYKASTCFIQINTTAPFLSRRMYITHTRQIGMYFYTNISKQKRCEREPGAII